MSKNQTSPSQLEEMKVAPVAAFRFLVTYGDMKGTKKYVDYKPAQIHRGKKWFVYYSYRHPETGKFIRFKVYEDINRVKDLKEREELAKELKDSVDNGLKRGYTPFDNEVKVFKSWTVVQGLNYFKQNLPTRGLRKRTVQSYESVLKFLYEYLPMNIPIKELTKHQIGSAFKNAYSKREWSNITFNNYITFTKSIWNYLIEEEITDSNPVKIKPLPQLITKHKYFSDEVFKEIKKKAPEDLLRFIMFLYHTGTRPNEARQLKYEHILKDRKLLFIPATISKNKKDDYIPLSEYIIENYKGTGFIFGVSVNYFGQKFTDLKKELKLHKDYTLYSIKHTRGIHLAQDGADPYTIMQLFRHSDLGITQSYLRELGVNLNMEAVNKGIKF